MLILEILSWIATTLALVANIPQVFRVCRNKSSANISILTNFTWLFIVLVMFFRALLIVKDLVFIVSQGSQAIIMVILITVILIYRRKNA